MKTFGELVNTLLSTFTIIGLIIGLYRSHRPALVIDRVVVHTEKDKSNRYHVIFENRKSFPVTIKNIRAFTQRKTRVEMSDQNPPVIFPFLDYEYCCINSSDELIIEASGVESKTIRSNLSILPKDEIIFSINTTHGYQLLKCNNIKILDLGVAKATHMKHIGEYNKTAATLVYFFLWLRFLKNNFHDVLVKMRTNK